MFRKILALLMCAAFLPLLCGEARAEGENNKVVELPIVMYHHMSPKPRLWGQYVLSPEQFERDLIYLRENGYTTITTAQLTAWCRGEGQLPEKPVMITFDDGYESTAVYALPLLEKYAMTAVVSVIGSVAQQYTDLPDHMLDYSHMSWEAAAQWEASDSAEMQCHTYDMHKLSRRKGCTIKSGESAECYEAALTADIEKFQESFEKYIGHRASALALPFGFYCADTLDIAKKLGFVVVFTCTERVNHLTGDAAELMQLCRYNRPSGPDSAAFFAKWG